MTISRSERRVIRIAAAIVVNPKGELLLVRKQGTKAFMLLGGKISNGEAADDALARELREELGWEIESGAHQALGRFTAPAANEPDTIVEADLYRVEYAGEVAPAAEIAEARWHQPGTQADFVLAPLARDHALPLVRDWSRV